MDTIPTLAFTGLPKWANRIMMVWTGVGHLRPGHSSGGDWITSDGRGFGMDFGKKPLETEDPSDIPDGVYRRSKARRVEVLGRFITFGEIVR